MTRDVIALTPTMPDPKTVLAGLFAGGPDLEVRTVADGAVVQLCTPDGRTLVSVEAPFLVHTLGEAQRLLGREVRLPDVPFWWTEARASTAYEEAERLAGSFAGRVATVLGGTVWPPEAAHTDVVSVATDESGEAQAATPPAVDALTDDTAVVIQDRAVVAMTSWLSDALRRATADDRALTIVTPPHTTLTLPTRIALQGHPNRWVVQGPGSGYYDGLSGAELHWQGTAFAPVLDADGGTRVADSFKPAPDTGERQLIIYLRTRHDADESLVLGGALEAAFRRLTGAPPAGWGTAEPISLPWSTRQLTGLARSRAPRPTWLLTVGGTERPALATTGVTRTTAGVEEEITLTLGYGADEPVPLDAVQPLAETLAAGHGLMSMLTSLRAARRDLTVPPRFEPPPVPAAFTLGPDAVRDIGPAHAGRPPMNISPVSLGPAAAPALHYPLGDGSDYSGWEHLEKLMSHLEAGK
ncbi:DUF6177 family protein [Streptomyces silvensis]|uniref:Uncharacterized protein n=1 Tax=Streptomyces silvensis TaxID=1765722 RepID=A0A0W7WR83_9ACTN|nr:DUF6177 family protein [Streptomyces silvensis]KUF13015.1 hypothetical protein AT728_37375 [Streptomyces silvensis]